MSTGESLDGHLPVSHPCIDSSVRPDLIGLWTGRIIPVSTLVRGHYGITEEVFLSLPCVIGLRGVRDIVSVTLDHEEQEMLRRSAATIAAVQTPLGIDKVVEEVRAAAAAAASAST